jgi:hypothetical protein
MVDTGMGRNVAEAQPQFGNELLAPNDRMTVLFEGLVAAELVGDEEPKYVLFDYDGTTANLMRTCNPREIEKIKKGFDDGDYNLCSTNFEGRGRGAMFVTL